MKIILFLLIILFIPLINASYLGISPARIEFNGTINEEICKNINIKSDYIGNIIGELKFTKNIAFSKNIIDYDKDAEYFNLNAEYPETIVFKSKDKKEINICINGGKIGNYKGALIYKTENGFGGVGIWVFVNLIEDKLKNIKLGMCCTPTIFLSALLVVLVIYNKNNNYKES